MADAIKVKSTHQKLRQKKMDDEDVPRVTVFPESSFDEEIQEDSVMQSGSKRQTGMKERRQGEIREVMSKVGSSATSRKQGTAASGLEGGGKERETDDMAAFIQAAQDNDHSQQIQPKTLILDRDQEEPAEVLEEPDEAPLSVDISNLIQPNSQRTSENSHIIVNQKPEEEGNSAKPTISNRQSIKQ